MQQICSFSNIFWQFFSRKCVQAKKKPKKLLHLLKFFLTLTFPKPAAFGKKYHVFNEKKEQTYLRKINISHILPQSLLFHTKPDLIQLPQNLVLPFFPRYSKKAGSCPQSPDAAPVGISSSAVSWGEAWVQVFVDMGLLYLGWLQTSKHERRKGARARTKLTLKPQGFQTQLRHTRLL